MSQCSDDAVETGGLAFADPRYDALRSSARDVLTLADRKGVQVATAESCTGGLLSTIFTDIPGVSHRFECGFVVYSDEAKSRLLGVPRTLITKHGAVSEAVALEMANCALACSGADVAVSVTGFAGPGESGDEEGLVHIAVASARSPTFHAELHFGAIGRQAIRIRALEESLTYLERYLPLL